MIGGERTTYAYEINGRSMNASRTFVSTPPTSPHPEGRDTVFKEVLTVFGHGQE